MRGGNAGNGKTPSLSTTELTVCNLAVWLDIYSVILDYLIQQNSMNTRQVITSQHCSKES